MKRGFSKIGFVAAVLVSALGLAGAASAQQVNWSGFYAGVEAGGARATSDLNFLRFTNGAGVVVSTNPDPGGPTDPIFTSGLIGGHVGYMQDLGGLVVGIDAAWDKTNLNGSSIFNKSVNPPGTLAFGISSIGTVNGRLGVANGRWLAYAAGGLAFANMNSEQTGQCTDNTNTPIPGCAFRNAGTFSHTGWDAGAGIAYALSNSLVLVAEYNHVDLGAFEADLPDANGGGGFQTMGFHPQIDVVKARLSFKFGAREPEHEPLK